MTNIDSNTISNARRFGTLPAMRAGRAQSPVPARSTTLAAGRGRRVPGAVSNARPQVPVRRRSDSWPGRRADQGNHSGYGRRGRCVAFRRRAGLQLADRRNRRSRRELRAVVGGHQQGRRPGLENQSSRRGRGCAPNSILNSSPSSRILSVAVPTSSSTAAAHAERSEHHRARRSLGALVHAQARGRDGGLRPPRATTPEALPATERVHGTPGPGDAVGEFQRSVRGPGHDDRCC